MPLEPDNAAINALLSGVFHTLEAVQRDEQIQNAQFAHLFDPFKYLRDTETGISRIIADLLDPRGSHGQGPAFLETFCGILGIHSKSSDSLRSARVTTEEPTTEIRNEKRRIDIWIDILDAELIAVEAKPFVAESKHQFGDYVEHTEALALRRANGKREDAFFIFLTPDGREPHSVSKTVLRRLQAEGRLRLLTYNGIRETLSARHHSIKEWLDLCLERELPDRLAWFLREFARHLALLFPTNDDIQGGLTMGREKALADFIANCDPDEMKAAWHIACAKDAIYSRTISTFGSKLIDELKKYDPTFLIEYDTILSDPLANYAGFVWRKSDWPKCCGMALEISEGYMSIGICAPTPEARDRMEIPGAGAVNPHTQEAIHDIIKPLLPAIGQTKRSAYWPIFVIPSAPLNGTKNVDFLLTIAGAEPFQGRPAIDVIFDCFKAMHSGASRLMFRP